MKQPLRSQNPGQSFAGQSPKAAPVKQASMPFGHRDFRSWESARTSVGTVPKNTHVPRPRKMPMLSQDIRAVIAFAAAGLLAMIVYLYVK